MKLFTSLSLVCALFVASAYCTEQSTESIQGISYGAFPCSWSEEARVGILESQVYQCVNIRGRSAVDYVFSPVPGYNDNYSVSVLNYTQYINWSSKKPYSCINHRQCDLKDASLKKGSYLLDLQGEDLFVVLTDQNRIERAFINVALRVYSP